MRVALVLTLLVIASNARGMRKAIEHMQRNRSVVNPELESISGCAQISLRVCSKGRLNALSVLTLFLLELNPAIAFSPPAPAPAPGILLTGLPGVGKSTACRRVAELCAQRGLRVEGFITEELRERGARVGFDVVELGTGAGGRRVPLARVGDGLTGPRVGKYTVALEEFESLAIPVLDRISHVAPGDRVVCIIDEIGKMELFSKPFVSRMRTLLDKRPVPMLFTIALRGGGFIAEAKRVPGLDYIEIDRETRDAAPENIISKLLGDQPGASSGSPRVADGIAGERAAVSARAPRSSRWNAAETRAAAADITVDFVTAADAAAADVTVEFMATSDANAAPGKTGKSETVSKPIGSKRWRSSANSFGKAAVAEESSSVQRGGRVIVWFRNELRLADNPLLSHAVDLCRQHQCTLDPVVCLDPRDFGNDVQTPFGSPKVGSARRRFLEEAIADLSRSLRLRGSRLKVCDAAPETVLAALASPGDVVLAVQEVCQEETDAERRVEAALKKVGAELRLLDSGGITTIFGSDDLQTANVGIGTAFPEDFKIFYNSVRNRVPQICQMGICSVPSELPATGQEPRELPGLRSEESNTERSPSPAPPTVAGPAGPALCGGESAGLARMRSWLQDRGLNRYKATFRHLLGDYSSRLSAHLACGCLSPRRLCAEALSSVRSGPHVEHFIYEMCWRDFFRHAARRWGNAMFKRNGPLGPSAPDRAWMRDAESEERWRCGMTGVPLVDAAMRELRATGYMGNLARQFAAAHLIEELRLDWRVGADWFESALVDYDPHSNWGQWARSAGVAPTNEAKRQRVGGTRYFDIALQMDQDEAARYVRGWVPELATLPDSLIFAPWRGAAAELGGYPCKPLCSDALRRYFESGRQRGSSPKGRGKDSTGRGRSRH